MANLFNRVGMALTAGLSAGWTAALAAYSQNALVDDVALDRQDFGYFPYRQSRYDLYWALYENSAYGDKNDSLHYFTKGLKEDRRLYKGIAHILNPIFRVVSFHEGHIWGGVLGKDAGDEDAETCLPVVTDQPAVRPEIARLWRDSTWQVNKDLTTRMGSALGDVGIEIVDDVAAGKVRLCPVHPRKIANVELDPGGCPTYYELSWLRPDPRVSYLINGRPVLARYTETVTLEGVDAVYRTFIDDVRYPFVWPGNDTFEWSIPYGFLPFVFIPHIKSDPDSPWGWSETHAGLSKVFTVDDLASLFRDKIRKDVRSPALLAGVQDPSALRRQPATNENLAARQAAPSALLDEDSGSRSFLYAPDVHARAHPLTVPGDYKGTVEFLRFLMEEFKRHYPELQTDEVQPTVDISGIALEMSQRLAEDKVYTRRAVYDSGLVEAIEKARAIASWRKYRGYGTSGLDYYLSGDRAFSFGTRHVFRPLASQKAQQRLQNAQAMTEESKTLPLAIILERDGWTEDQIKEVEDARAKEDQKAIDAMQAAAPPQPAPGAPAFGQTTTTTGTAVAP
jgi:hypothetical protein